MDVSPSHSPSRDSNPSDGSESRTGETHWLVDAYNVLHAALLPGDLRSQIRWWDREGRERLINRVCRFRPGHDPEPDAHKKDPSEGSNRTSDSRTESIMPTLWIVFDGDRAAPDEQDLPAHIRIIFAPSADDYLVSRSRRATPDESIYVVSSDKRVAGRCAHAGATVIKPTDFLAQCPEPESPTRPPTE